MHSKLALFEGMSPEQKGALIGSLLGAGLGGLGGAFGSKKDKLRNSILAALAGGAGGAGLGYLGGRYFAPNPIAKAAPEAAKAINDPLGSAFSKVMGAAGKNMKGMEGFVRNSPKGGISANELGEEARSGPMAGVDPEMLDQEVPGFEIPIGTPQGGGEPGVAPKPANQNSSGPLPYALPAR